MRYLTDRKRAEGKGAAHTGTEYHWRITVTAVAMAFLIPTFLFILGNALGGTREEVLATFSRPFPAILTALTFVVGMMHFKPAAEIVILDYTHGSTRKLLIMLVIGLTWTLAATVLFALVKIAV